MLEYSDIAALNWCIKTSSGIKKTLPVGHKELLLLLLMVLTLSTEGLLGFAPSIFPASAPLQNAIFLQIR